MKLPLWLLIGLLCGCGSESDPAGAITGHSYYDKNLNNTQDDGEADMAGVEVFLDYNNNGAHDEGEPITTTDVNGNFALTGEGAEDDVYSVVQLTPLQFTNHDSRITDGPTKGDVSTVTSDIIGGTETDTTKYPFMGSLQLFQQHSCGGALISGKWAVTAAHCVEPLIGADDPDTVRFGSKFWSTGGTNAVVKQVIKHPDWNPRTGLENDIALIEFEDTLMIPRAVLMEEKLREKGISKVNSKVMSIGWGRVNPNTNNGSNVLLEIEIELISDSVCNTFTQQPTSTKFICAGEFEPGVYKTACNGDSGGPLIQKDGDDWVHLGVVSHGTEQNCPENKPGVYTETVHYLDFFRQHLTPETKPIDATDGDHVVFANFR